MLPQRPGPPQRACASIGHALGRKVHAIDPFEVWYAALERRHTQDLRFAEIRRGVQALSSLYVERRARLARGAALDGAGKRAAFALFYAPLHFLVVRGIVRALEAGISPPRSVVDLGCGTGPAGAAWALEAAGAPEILGVERSAWAVGEARWTLKTLGLRGRVERADLCRAPLPGRGGAVLLAFTVNEIGDADRGGLLGRIVSAAKRGAGVLLVEPLSRRALPWWDTWQAAVLAAGGRHDVWRLAVALPESLRLLDRAAGLDHREVGARSLWLPGAIC